MSRNGEKHLLYLQKSKYKLCEIKKYAVYVMTFKIFDQASAMPIIFFFCSVFCCFVLSC